MRRSSVRSLYDWAARLPWFVSASIAALLWLVFYQLRRCYFDASWFVAQPGAILNPLRGIVGGASLILEWSLPLVFGLGASVGLFRRWRRALVFARAARNSTRLLTAMSWEDFERLVADAFTRGGYDVQARGGGQADGGVDLVVCRNSRRFLVQCKQWRTKKVSVAAVRELLGVVSANAADGGFLVSASSFTKEAEAFANGRGIRLLDNARLHAMMQEAAPTGGASARPVRPAATLPRCPACSQPMVKRVAQKGRGTGEPFWGCGNFPRCRAVRSID